MGMFVCLMTLAVDCFQLGQYAYYNKDWFHMLSWLQEALYKLEMESNATVSRTAVLDHLSYAAVMVSHS